MNNETYQDEEGNCIIIYGVWRKEAHESDILFIPFTKQEEANKYCDHLNDIRKQWEISIWGVEMNYFYFEVEPIKVFESAEDLMK